MLEKIERVGNRLFNHLSSDILTEHKLLGLVATTQNGHVVGTPKAHSKGWEA